MADVRTFELVEGAAEEDVFVVPAAWRRFRLARRSSGASARAIRPAAIEQADGLVERFRSELYVSLSSPGTAAGVEAAGWAVLDDDPAAPPLGAAAVVHALATQLWWSEMQQVTVFADHWLARRGLPFAAAAVAELMGLGPSPGSGTQPIPRATASRDITDYVAVTAVKLAHVVRRAAATAGETEYAEVIAALAPLRGDRLAQRAVISLMVPDRTDWVDEDCAAIRPAGLPEATALLLQSVTSPGLAIRLVAAVNAHTALHDPVTVHSLVEGVGAAAAPALADLVDRAWSTDDKQRLHGLLAAIPTDEAFGLLLDRLGEPHVRAAVSEAAGRFPRRAIRLLAASDRDAAADLLRTHLATHLDLVPQVLAGLDGAAAARLSDQVAAFEAGNVAVAPPESVPALLVTPPWLDRERAAPTVVAGLTCADPVRLRWAPGERDAWSSSRVARRARGWTVPMAPLIGTGRMRSDEEIDFFLEADDDLARPLLATWKPADFWYFTDRCRAVVSRFEEDAVPVLIAAGRRAPSSLAEVFLPIESPEVAALMATWLAKLKTVRPVALAWFARHADAAARALVPAAAGRPGTARSHAETAVRAMAAAGHLEQIRSAALGHGPQALTAIEEVLAVDPLTVLPVATLPATPAWAEPTLLPPVRLTDGSGALPPDAVRHLITMLAISRLDTPYAGIALVQQSCVPADLADLAWELFRAWQQAGSPAKENWTIDALGLLGDDGTVRRLTPVIRAWPGAGGHARAVAGLDVLAAIGTDVALMYLNGIAQKVKFKGLKDRAEEKIAELAAGLGLTADELADRLVPDLGLGADGSLVLDYGRRSFTVGFDEQLRPYVMDAGGKPLKALPKPGVQDDPALAPDAYRRFAALKKDVRAVAADQIRRLEQAMAAQRRWDATTLRRLFVDHPLVRHLVRRLVWVRTAADGTALSSVRVAEDGTFADRNDELVEPADSDLLGVAHPVQLGDDVVAWAEVFADYQILQPFAQLGRDVHRLAPGEAEQTRLTRAEDRTVPVGKLLGLERHGWRRGSAMDNGVQSWLHRDLPGDLRVFAEIEPGIVVGMVDRFPDQRIEKLWIGKRTDDPWGRRDRTGTRLGTLDPITVSELLRDLAEVLA
jgi:uncharacterized protein DUF4132